MTGTGPRVHIVGAGLAGLSCAVELAASGRRVSLYEAAAHAGGRCRSWHDTSIDRTIDNGNHLLLSGNSAALKFLCAVGAEAELAGPAGATLPFLDLADGTRWTLRPNAGRVPWWMLSAGRRVAGAGAAAHLRGLLTLRTARPDATVGAALGGDPLYRRLWEPMATSILNTPAGDASSALLWRTMQETLVAGGAACRPLVARHSLNRTFIAPAASHLSGCGVTIHFHTRIRGFIGESSRVTALHATERDFTVGPADNVVLAVPPTAASELISDISVPDRHHAIVNAHYRLDRTVVLPGGLPILGLVGGTAQWLFARGDVVSVTVSAADALATRGNEAIADLLWCDVAAVLKLGKEAVPPHRIVKEKRATFAQTPDQTRRRPGTCTALDNLFLAGDWTDTGVPATIEGAIRSGQAAATAVMAAQPG